MVMVRAWAWMPLLLGLACVAFLAGSAFFAYQTGCAADLKTGGVGNIQLAFHYGDLGAGCFWPACSAALPESCC
ncbi:hypothetical protein KJI95_05545 [Shewanella sp. JM162201]|uniref:Uncharacterized protein n=1 Tax=Shewanella jiangmenensis TaxID=2837387 RepID=A0ABS5V2T4_9GAMM|nr:hypothetical protein [Shewanella jiangmenensis]MBT1443989.1 hypothetical protein [Shewanella jiangmenensis]